jgi:hypothetical protein
LSKIIFFNDTPGINHFVILKKSKKIMMKRIFTFLSAMLLISALRAQKTTVQKETIKPVADTLEKASKLIRNPAATSIKKTQKDAKLAPAAKNAIPVTKELKKATLEK